MDPYTLATNLERLCAKLQPPSPEASKLAGAIPFSRAHSPAGFRAISESRMDLATRAVKQLLGQPTSRESPTCTESWLHTDDCVFYYLSGFGYPNTEAGFLFKQSLAQGGLASPFDSGALWEWVDWPNCPPAGTANPAIQLERAEQARAFLAQHSMAGPDCRSYLAQFLSHAFTDPFDYLRGTPPTGDDLHGLTPCSGKSVDHRRWTFEMRLPTGPESAVPLPGPHLEAVFYRETLATDPDVARFLIECRKTGAQVIPFSAVSGPSGFKALQRAGIDYLDAKLNVPSDS
jgi:hypothetical protein